jgi:YVTN family beta-propeller protein
MSKAEAKSQGCNMQTPKRLVYAAFVTCLLIAAFGDRTWADSRSPAVYLPLLMAGPAPTTFSWGSPIAISPDGASVWVANPDAGSVTQLDTKRLAIAAEIPVGREPWSLAVAPDGGSVYVVDRADGTLAIVDARTSSVRARLAVGAEPGSVALSPTGATAYVSVTAADELIAVDTMRLQIIARIPVAPHPYALTAGMVDGRLRIYVTHLLALARPDGDEARDDGRAGQITVIDAATNTIAAKIVLPPDQHGFPNLLAGISAVGQRAWVPTVRAAPDLPNDPTGCATSLLSQ